jgi:N6-adenosine-specific RNA methylase IME4
MVEAHDVARAWGFEPKTIITWVKHKQGEPTTPSMKMGYWFRSASEHCLFAVRGSLRLNNKICLPTWFAHPRLPHSVKPDSFRQMVEKASPGPYLELFARKTSPGWSIWGNEVESTFQFEEVST